MIPEEEEGLGLVIELILSLPVHTESLLSILFAFGETDEELICGSVAFKKTCDWLFLFFDIHTS